VAAALAPVYLAAAYFTYTRSVWLGFALALLFFLLMALRGKWRALVVLGAVGAAVLVVAVKGDSLVAFKRDTSAADTAESTYMRASFAYVSWRMFQERPLTGIGFGQFPKESIHYLGDRSTSLRLEAIRGYIHHNTFLSVLVEMGLFGLVLLLAFYFLWARQAWQLWRRADLPVWVRGHGLLLLTVLGPYFLQMLFREVSYSPVENGLMFFLAGTTGSLHATYVAAARCQPATRTALAARLEATT
ncbi:MAG: O-antigen ligase family protein, partial [Planctomycetales bacterium]|nr:O-antigen ligase family protein [Planctomycetales bacterium]